VLGVGFSAVSIAGVRPLVLADRRSAAAVAALQPRITLLQELDLFASLPRTALEELARSLEEERVEPGEVLIREGDAADALWILLAGHVEVLSHAESQWLPSLGPGSYFGEIGLLRGVPRTATVRAIQPCTLYRIAAEPFLEAVQGGRASGSLLPMADIRLYRSHPRLSSGVTEPAR
jgi:CRP-like cAMP-binding protein